MANEIAQVSTISSNISAGIGDKFGPLAQTISSLVLSQLEQRDDFSFLQKEAGEGTRYGQKIQFEIQGLEKVKATNAENYYSKDRIETVKNINKYLEPFESFLQKAENKYLKNASEEDQRAAYEQHITAKTEGQLANPLVRMAFDSIGSFTGLTKESKEAAKNRAEIVENAAKRGESSHDLMRYAKGSYAADHIFDTWQDSKTEDGSISRDEQGYRKGRWKQEAYDRDDYSGFNKAATSKLASTLTGQQDFFGAANMIEGKKGSMDEAVRKLQAAVKSYAKALAPLKDVFGNDMNKIVQVMESLSGTSLSKLGTVRTGDIAQKITKALRSGNFSAEDVEMASDVIKKKIAQQADKVNLTTSAINSSMDQTANYMSARGTKSMSPFTSKEQDDAIVQKYTAEVSNSRGAQFWTAAVTKEMDNIDKQTNAAIAEVQKDTKLTDKEKEEKIKGIRDRADLAKSNAGMNFTQKAEALAKEKGISVEQAASELSGIKSQADVEAATFSNNYQNAVGQGQEAALAAGAGAEQKEDLKKALKNDSNVYRVFKEQFGADEKTVQASIDTFTDLLQDEKGKDVLSITDGNERLNALKQLRDSGHEGLKGKTDEELAQISALNNYTGQNQQLNEMATKVKASSNVKTAQKQAAQERVERTVLDKVYGSIASNEEAFNAVLGNGATDAGSIETNIAKLAEEGKINIDPNDKASQEAFKSISKKFSHVKRLVDAQYNDKEHKETQKQLDKAVADSEKVVETKEARVKELEEELSNTKDPETQEEVKRDIEAAKADLKESKDAVKQAKEERDTYKKQMPKLKTDAAKDWLQKLENPEALQDKTTAAAMAELEKLDAVDTSKMSDSERKEHDKKVAEQEKRLAIGLNGGGAALDAVESMRFSKMGGGMMSKEEDAAYKEKLLDKMAKDPANATKIAQNALINKVRNDSAGDEQKLKLLTEFQQYQIANGLSGTEGYDEWSAKAREKYKKDKGAQLDLDSLSGDFKEINEATVSKESQAETARQNEQQLYQQAAELVIKYLNTVIGGQNNGNPKDESVK